MLQRTLPAGFIAPCLPTKTDKLPCGSQWLHEIKHDGFRIIARKNGAQVRLYSRPGNDLTDRFPLIVETLARLRSRSCIIDSEAVVCDDNGWLRSIWCGIATTTKAYFLSLRPVRTERRPSMAIRVGGARRADIFRVQRTDRADTATQVCEH